jgi:hypothetical protein
MRVILVILATFVLVLTAAGLNDGWRGLASSFVGLIFALGVIGLLAWASTADAKDEYR